MSFFTNKHVVVAMIAAPILAVIAYLAVDRIVTPDPVPAQEGDVFPLAARSNCRYESGKCTLWNGDFKVELTVVSPREGPTLTLDLTSEFPIQGMRYALIDQAGSEVQAESLSTAQFVISQENLARASSLQLAVRSAGVTYYTETQIKFLAIN